MTSGGGQSRAACLEPIDILVAASGDWHAHTPVNSQEIARRWVAYGRVDYLEPAPLRAPSWSDRGRVVGRIRRLLGRSVGDAEVARPAMGAGPTVHAPWYVPWHPTPLVLRANASLARRRVGRTRQRDVLWVFTPALAGCVDAFPAKLVVYHAVDDYAANPGVRPILVRRAEDRIVARADVVFVSSRPLLERLSTKHDDVHLFENATDTDLLRPLPIPSGSTRKAVYVGNVAPHKVDFELLREVAQRSPEWEILIIGPVQAEDGVVSPLFRLPNVRHLGPATRADFASLLAEADVALLPLPKNTLRESSFPMKVADYFALGLPVVGPITAGLTSVRNLISEAETAEEFVAAMEEGAGLRRDGRYVAAARREAEARSWGRRMEDIRALLASRLGDRAATPSA